MSFTVTKTFAVTCLGEFQTDINDNHPGITTVIESTRLDAPDTCIITFAGSAPLPPVQETLLDAAIAAWVCPPAPVDSTAILQTVTAPATGEVLAFDGTDWVPTAFPVFGEEFDENESDSQSTTNSTSYQEKLSLTVNNLDPAHKYRIGYSYEWRLSSTSYDFIAQIELNNSTNIMDHDQEPKDGFAWHLASGFKYVTGYTGTLDIDLDYRSENNSATAYIRKARLEIWRVS